VGQKVGDLTGRYRARQNVVFEHGYLIGKLGRSRVSAIIKDVVEIPNAYEE
jgi:predicted nucleotide-binding protein